MRKTLKIHNYSESPLNQLLSGPDKMSSLKGFWVFKGLFMKKKGRIMTSGNVWYRKDSGIDRCPVKRGFHCSLSFRCMYVPMVP